MLRFRFRFSINPVPDMKVLLCRFRLFCFFNLLGLLLAAPLSAQRPRVGLALSGGGAKGVAQVGVLKVLEEEGIPVDYIAGTSIGSIVGGLYSVGYRADSLAALFRTADWQMLLSDQPQRRQESFLSKQGNETYVVSAPVPFHSKLKRKRNQTPVFGSKGLVPGHNILNLFTRLTVGYHDVKDFGRLPIPFTAVAVDLHYGIEAHLSSGSLPQAMRASMSIPAMFEPVEWGDWLLVDGGAINNFPVDVVRGMGADFVIGIDLSQGGYRQGEMKGVSSVVNRLISIMGKEKYEQNSRSADLYVNPRLDGYNMMSFSRSAIDSMYRRGYETASLLRPQLRELRRRWHLPPADSLRPVPPAAAGNTTYSVGDITFEGSAPGQKEWLLKRTGLREHALLRADEVDHAVAVLQGLGIFGTVTYRLSSSAPYDLIFRLEPVGQERINVGARFDNEDIATIIVNLSNQKNFNTLHHYSVTGRISANPYFRAEYNFGRLFGPQAGVAFHYRYNDFSRYDSRHRAEVVDFHATSFALFYHQAFRTVQLEAGVRQDFFSKKSPLLFSARADEQMFASKHYFNYYAEMLLDTYDRLYFPMRGWHATARGELYTTNSVGLRSRRPVCSVGAGVETACRLTDRFYVLPAVAGRFVFGTDVPGVYANYVGGVFDGMQLPQQRAWETGNHLHGLPDKWLALKAHLRYRLKERIYLSAIGEYGKAANTLSALPGGTSLWGWALRGAYDFLLGPVSVQMNYSSVFKRLGWYVNAGFYF